MNKFKQKLQCICNSFVYFEFIEEIECDWGVHTIIQCPKCEELFSIDKKCPAFNDVFELTNLNPNLYSEQEKSNYVRNCHPC